MPKSDMKNLDGRRVKASHLRATKRRLEGGRRGNGQRSVYRYGRENAKKSRIPFPNSWGAVTAALGLAARFQLKEEKTHDTCRGAAGVEKNSCPIPKIFAEDLRGSYKKYSKIPARGGGAPLGGNGVAGGPNLTPPPKRPIGSSGKMGEGIGGLARVPGWSFGGEKGVPLFGSPCGLEGREDLKRFFARGVSGPWFAGKRGWWGQPGYQM